MACQRRTLQFPSPGRHAAAHGVGLHSVHCRSSSRQLSGGPGQPVGQLTQGSSQTGTASRSSWHHGLGKLSSEAEGADSEGGWRVSACARPCMCSRQGQHRGACVGWLQYCGLPV